MSRTKNEKIKTLKTYKKEEILEALEQAYRHYPFHADLMLKIMVDYLENKKRKDVIAAHDKALEREQVACAAYRKWCDEIIEKYGTGEEKCVKLADIPSDEFARGLDLEAQMHKAIKDERALDAKVTSLLGI